MSEMISTMSFANDMHFVGELDGHQIPVDADSDFGGQGLGPRPKGLVLTALAGCTGMDVISILKKMRIAPTGFDIDATAQVSEEHPKVFTHIQLTYRFKGELPREKLEKAITLSLDQYCAVTAMLKQVVPIDWEIVIEP